MLNESSIRMTVAPAAVLSFAALPPLKNGRVNAITISRIARQRSSNSSRLCSVRRRIVRCGTWRTNTSAGNCTRRARVRRTRCTSTGAASAATPRKNNGVKNDIKLSTDFTDYTENKSKHRNNLCNLWIKLSSSATRQEREQRKIQRLFCCQHFIVDVVRRRATSHVLDVLSHALAIAAHHHIRKHGHLFLCLRVFEQQHGLFEIEIELVLIEHVKCDEVVSFETQVLERFL